MKITVVGVVLIVALVAAGVLFFLALRESQERTPQTDTNADCREHELWQDEMDTIAQ